MFPGTDRGGESPPRIFQYLDYRSFLADWFRWRKAVDRAFSLRAFARHPDLALSSSSFLSAVLRGRKNLSQSLRLRFARALGLAAGELEYFELLVQYTQSRTPEERAHFLAPLSRWHDSRARILGVTQGRFFGAMRYRVIWALLALRPGPWSPARLGRAAVPPLSAAEAEEAVRALLDLGLIRRLANGYAISDRHLAAPPSFAGEAARRHQREVLELALAALDREPAGERHFASLALTVSERGFARIKERMDAFRAEIRELAEADTGGDRVVALGLQLFPAGRLEGAEAAPRSPGGRGAGAGGASSDAGNPE